jgi:hypothetical protein
LGAKDHYLQSPQIAAVFLSFLLLALPLSYIQLTAPFPPLVIGWLLVSYVVLFGNTHFAITWGLYLNSTNLGYFGSSFSKRLVYFLAPVLIFVTFCVIGLLELHRYPRVAIPYAIALAAADYFHVVRQSFGVFEMFKARSGIRFAPSLKRTANWYFLSLWALQLITFIRGTSRGFDGRYDPSNPPTLIASIVAAALFLIVSGALVNAWRAADRETRGALVTAFGYLLLQSASALLVVYRTRLYLPSLAMHYVEYHVLMAPRLFKAELNPMSTVDRMSKFFRRHKTVFYAILVAIAASAGASELFAVAGIVVTRDNSSLGWLYVNLLAGIFVAHYFVEAFVWKFGNPFYRKTLAPIYFTPVAVTTAARDRRGGKRRIKPANVS